MNRPMSLYEIDAEMARLMALVEEGEVPDEVEVYYQELLQLAVKKCDGYIWRIVEMEASNAASREVLKAMNERLNRREREVEALRERLAVFMENQGIGKLVPENKGLPKVVLMKGRPRLVYDEKRMPAEYLKLVPHADKSKVADALEQGASVPGVTKVLGSSYLTLK